MSTVGFGSIGQSVTTRQHDAYQYDIASTFAMGEFSRKIQPKNTNVGMSEAIQSKYNPLDQTLP